MIRTNKRDSILGQGTLEGWLYPDNTINATNHITSGQLHTVSALWYEIGSLLSATGTVVANTGSKLWKRDITGAGSNWYFTSTNAETLRKYSVEQYVNVTTASNTDSDTIFSSSTNRAGAVTELVNFCVTNYFTGVDLDLEIFSIGGLAATVGQYTNFKTFCRELGAALHKVGKKLRIDAPAIWNSSTSVTANEWTNRNSTNYYTFKYEDFENFPEVDSVVIMAYDYYTDNALAFDANASIAPLEWMKDTYKFVRTKITNPDRLIAGIPNYGIYGNQGSYTATQRTYYQMKSRTGYSTATRHTASKEMKFTDTAPTPDVDNYYIDEYAFDQKRLAALACGITRHCVWALDGVSKLGSSGIEPMNYEPKATPRKPIHYVTLTDAVTIATDASNSTMFTVTLGGNRTLGNPTYAADGQVILWEIKQDATGTRTLALDTKFAFGTDIASVTATTTASKRDFLLVQYRSADDKFYVLDFKKGY
jgi:hypothetical protein